MDIASVPSIVVKPRMKQGDMSVGGRRRRVETESERERNVYICN
jgi:hypothetical protein